MMHTNRRYLQNDQEPSMSSDLPPAPVVFSLNADGKSDNVTIESDSTRNRWTHDSIARNTLLVALTAFYCIIMTIFGLVVELSHLISNEHKRIVHFQDLAFGAYMYGVSIAFFIYCYAVILVSPGWVGLRKLTSIIPYSGSRLNMDTSLYNVSAPPSTEQRRATHNGLSSGNLFLRLGCIVFGVIGVVYNSFSTFLCVVDDDCETLVAVLDIAAIIFTFAQMHFIFCNWKVSILGSRVAARFGTMHLIAANLWTWIRYILIEESVMNGEIREIFYNASDHEGTDSDLSTEIDTFLTETSKDHSICKDSDCLLGSMTELMYTSMVEYSLIGAAVMFIVWHNIDQVRDCNSSYVKRKYQIRVDCSKTTSGLFFGLLYLSATLTAMAVFYGYSASNRTDIAATVYGLTDVVQYLVSGAGCIYALWRMRLLHFVEQPENAKQNSQELLDLILLSLGLIGEMIYSVAGMLGLTAERNWQSLTFILLTMHIMRLLQTGLQASLIFIGGKLRIQGDEVLREQQPGKQTITFLLVANISMFLMNLFEAEKAGISETVVNFYGKRSWVFLVRSFGPLTIFFRFHSSVCLAEIWKNAYAWKSP